MFLHSGASLHGHEYSNKQPHLPQHPVARRSPLFRSTLASLPPPRLPPTAASSSSSHPPPPLPRRPACTFSSVSSVSSVSTVSRAPSAPSASSTALPPRPCRTAATALPGASQASILRPSPANAPHPDAVSRPARPRLRERPVSDGSYYAAKLSEPVVRFQDPVVTDSPARRLPSPPRSQPRPKKPESMSEDESSYSASEATEASYASDQASATTSILKQPARRRRRAPRQSTAFIFAHPAPKLRTKKQLLKLIRPTLLLQLQQLSDRRPLPVIDVYPASLISGNVAATRFSKLPRIFGINGELGLHDTILVRSEHYSSSSHAHSLAYPSTYESDAEDDSSSSFEHRTLLAVLSPLRREDRSEIALDDGAVWTTSTLANGSYDFVRSNADGSTTTARWVRRTVARPDNASDSDAGLCCVKFTFSLIDPNSRRHPIMATLTRKSLDVLDHYTTVSSSSGRYPPSRPIHVDSDASSDDEQHPQPDQGGAGHRRHHDHQDQKQHQRTTLPVDGALRDFICVSAIWLGLQLGWAKPSQTPFPCDQPMSLMTPPITPVTPATPATPAIPATPATAVSAETFPSMSSRCISETFPQISSNGMRVRPASVSYAGLPDVRGRRLLSLKRNSTASPNTIGNGNGSNAPQDWQDSRGHALPTKKASSTGAAYMQRRMQLQQISDTSDSEKPAGPGLPGSRVRRPFSRFSGDFTPGILTKRHTSPHSETDNHHNTRPLSASRRAETSPPASVRGPVSSTTTPDLHSLASQPRASTGRRPLYKARSRSACYPSRAANTHATMSGSDLSDSFALQDSARASESDHGLKQHQPRAIAAADDANPAKWKKLGNWLKRFGRQH